MTKITDPILILEWIRKEWENLKEKGTLELAISKYLKASGEEDRLSIQDVIDIEESIPDYLNVKKEE